MSAYDRIDRGRDARTALLSEARRVRNVFVMAIAVYLRVSTEEQRERQSIATQREFGVRYCEFNALTVYRVYADDGVSGTVPIENRPEGSQMLRDARLGKFDQL